MLCAFNPHITYADRCKSQATIVQDNKHVFVALYVLAMIALIASLIYFKVPPNRRFVVLCTVVGAHVLLGLPFFFFCCIRSEKQIAVRTERRRVIDAIGQEKVTNAPYFFGRTSDLLQNPGSISLPAPILKTRSAWNRSDSYIIHFVSKTTGKLHIILLYKPDDKTKERWQYEVSHGGRDLLPSYAKSNPVIIDIGVEHQHYRDPELSDEDVGIITALVEGRHSGYALAGKN